MKGFSALVMGIAIVALTAAAGEAADAPADVDGGHALARAWCTSCHAVEPGEVVGPYADVPSFSAVARMPSTTALALHAFLSSPHHDMPDIKLTAAQLDQVVEYILSLRGPEGRSNP
jgi:cytochrome c